MHHWTGWLVGLLADDGAAEDRRSLCTKATKAVDDVVVVIVGNASPKACKTLHNTTSSTLVGLQFLITYREPGIIGKG